MTCCYVSCVTATDVHVNMWLSWRPTTTMMTMMMMIVVINVINAVDSKSWHWPAVYQLTVDLHPSFLDSSPSISCCTVARFCLFVCLFFCSSGFSTVMSSVTISLRTRPVSDQHNRSWSCLGLAGLVLWVKVRHSHVMLAVIMILKDTSTFQVLFIVSLFCAWNITTVEINSGVYLLKH